MTNVSERAYSTIVSCGSAKKPAIMGQKLTVIPAKVPPVAMVSQKALSRCSGSQILSLNDGHAKSLRKEEV